LDVFHFSRTVFNNIVRFKDGTILEACYWGRSTSGDNAAVLESERHHIPGKVAKYILDRHVKASR
jgi:hypothetical protein